VSKNFSQMIVIRCGDPAPVVELLEQWDLDQASTDIMGYMGTRLLADRQNPGRYVIIADFGVVDPDVSAADEASRNNDRPETQAWAARLLEVVEGDPEYLDYDELYRTDF
jgi:hypothetical protein